MALLPGEIAVAVNPWTFAPDKRRAAMARRLGGLIVFGVIKVGVIRRNRRHYLYILVSSSASSIVSKGGACFPIAQLKGKISGRVHNYGGHTAQNDLNPPVCR